jgi:hypothetical protein
MEEERERGRERATDGVSSKRQNSHSLSLSSSSFLRERAPPPLTHTPSPSPQPIRYSQSALLAHPTIVTPRSNPNERAGATATPPQGDVVDDTRSSPSPLCANQRARQGHSISSSIVAISNRLAARATAETKRGKREAGVRAPAAAPPRNARAARSPSLDRRPAASARAR